MNKYCKILSDKLGFTWDEKLFHVHHINHNRSDNNVSNLVLIPKKLHHEYHLYSNYVDGMCKELTSKDLSEPRFVNAKVFEKLVDIKSDMRSIYNAEQYAIAFREYNSEFDALQYILLKAATILSKYV